MPFVMDGNIMPDLIRKGLFKSCSCGLRRRPSALNSVALNYTNITATDDCMNRLRDASAAIAITTTCERYSPSAKIEDGVNSTSQVVGARLAGLGGDWSAIVVSLFLWTTKSR